MDLSDKVAIVTGSGRGLGLAYAKELARHGAAVVVNDVDAETVDRAVGEVVAKGGRAAGVVAPVGSSESAQKLVAAAVENFGRLDVMVTNAGILRDKVLWKMTDDDFDAFHDGGFSADDVAAERPKTFALHLESVGEKYSEELTAK